jgi:hypothetical protein
LRQSANRALTKAGREAFSDLDRRSIAAVSSLLEPLKAADRARLLEAMATIEACLAGDPVMAPVEHRSLQTGDIGWIAQPPGTSQST